MMDMDDDEDWEEEPAKKSNDKEEADACLSLTPGM